MTGCPRHEPLLVSVCRSCGHRAFPGPLLCARCGGAAFDAVAMGAARLERVTLVHRDLGGAIEPPSRVGRVVADDGVAIIARVDCDVAVGTRVELGLDGAAPVARAAAD